MKRGEKGRGIRTYLGVVSVVVVLVVEKLGGDHYARDGHAVDVQRRQRKVVPLDESVHVNQPQHEAFVAAARVLEDAVEVPFREREEKRKTELVRKPDKKKKKKKRQMKDCRQHLWQVSTNDAGVRKLRSVCTNQRQCVRGTILFYLLLSTARVWQHD